MSAKRLAIAGLLLAALSLTPSWGDSGSEGLTVLGVMPFALQAPYDVSSSGNSPMNLTIDGALHRGFLLVEEANGRHDIAVYDLRRLRREGTIAWPLADFNQDVAIAVDAMHHRLFIALIAGATNGTVSTRCSDGTTFVIVDTLRLSTSQASLPCVGGVPFAVEGLSYHAPSNKLYAIGMPANDYQALIASGADQYKVPTIFAQLDPSTLAVDWQADASAVCDWHETTGGSVVARYGDDLVSYCYQGGSGYNTGGTRGEALLMPIAPVAAGKMPTFVTSYTYTDSAEPVVDPGTGRLLLHSTVPPYGPAVWGYDPFAQRFVGVAPAGQAYTNADDQFNGFDPTSGRLYIVNPQGTVVIDTRGATIPGGITFPILRNMRGGSPTPGEAGYTHAILIDGGLHRLFIPYPKKLGFIVVQDGLPPYREAPPADPDQGTADIPEVAGSTTSSFSGAADAFGMHVVNVGGIPGAIDNWDQTCFDPSASLPSPRDLDPNRRCLADQLLTAGNREFYVAETGVDVESDSGVSAFGAVLHFPQGDSATSTDFRSVAGCYTDHFPDQVPASIRERVATTCRDDTPLGALQYGTQDPNGRDMPFPGSTCVSESGGVADDAMPTRAGTSSAHCDDHTFDGSALADTTPVAVPDPGSPIVSVAHASSSVTTSRTSAGTVTTVVSRASGIRIAGTFFIGEVYAEAVTAAHGRTGTTAVTFRRLISDVRGPGIDCVATCDPQTVADAFNRAFSTQGRMRAPDPYELASRHGYQALLIKDPLLRASDMAILNDDSDTFDGLDLIVNNDGFNASTTGPNARSRIVVELAGVHAESRYGIFPVSAGGGGMQFPGITTGIPGSVSSLPSRLGSGNGTQQVGYRPGTSGPGLVQAIVDTWGFIVNHPAQAALLFVFLGLLASPVYLGLRTRSLERSLRR